MATALEKIKSYRDRQKNPIKYIDINESSPLEKIKAYKKANPKSTPVNLDKIREQQNQPMITPVDIQSNTIKLPTAQTILPVEQKKQSSATELPVYELNKPSQNGIYSVPQKETVAKGWKGLDISQILKVPENFKDGYQFGDITKTIGSTALDLGTSATKGIFSLGEGIGDLAQYGVAQVGDWLGADDFADQLRKNAQQDVTSMIFNPAENMYGKNSVAGETTTQVAEGVGNVLGMAYGGGVLPKSMRTIGKGAFKIPTTSIVSSMGGGMTEAYNNGATDTEAWLYGLGSGFAEGFSESLFGGLGSKFANVYGGGALDDVLIKNVTNRITNSTMRTLAQSGLKAVGEGAEEVISGLGSAIAKKLTYLSDEEFSKIVQDENLLEQFVMGTLTSAIMQVPSTVNAVKNGTEYIGELQKNIESNTTQNTPKTVYDLVQQEKNSQNANLPIVDNNGNRVNSNINVRNNYKSSSFDDDMRKFESGNYTTNDMLTILDNIPEYFYNLGYNTDSPLVINMKKLQAIMSDKKVVKEGLNQHGITREIIEQLPYAISNPLNVIKNPNYRNRFVIVTELSDKYGDIVIVPIEIDVNGKQNRIVSIYGKEQYDGNDNPNIKGYMEQNIENIVYDIDNDMQKKSRPLDAPIALRDNSFNNNIPQSNNNVKSDISTKYSMQNQQNNSLWQDYLEQNYKATGTRTDMRKLLPTKEDIRKTELKDIKLPIKEVRKLNSQQKNNYVESKITKILNSQSYKAVNKASKVGQNYLYFNNTQKRNFKEKLMKYVGKTSNDLTNTKTWNEVKELVKEYANKDYIYVDEELKFVKNQVRSMNIKITEDLKRQITDYNDFRKENFGKLKLGNNGNTIDSIYQELSEQYPYYFGSAETQADMLYELSDFMNKDINIVEKYQFDDAYLEETTAKIFNNLMQNTLNEQQIEELRNNLEDKLNARTREVIQEELMQEMGITLDDISKGKDISSFDLSRTDPIRVNEKIFGAKVGDKINDATIRKTQANEASRIRFLNKERNEIKKLGIKAFSKESAAVQKYGEKQYINDKGDIISYGDKELIQEFPDIRTQQKIKKAAEIIRNKYDTYIDQINNVLVDMGYDAIKKRKDYMRHFQALNDVFSRFGIPLNAESLQSDSLPTDINGLTDQFKPGKQYFASAMQRIGMKTTYDAITGIDGYLEGASNLIYHTEDIQRYRALSKFIRNTYGAEHGFENVDKLTLPQQEQRIQDIQSNKLAKYVSWLDEQANALANKKGKIDRGVEEVFGRKVYQVLETAKKQVGSNMVGFNVRSALTNFASVVQGSSKTNKIAFLKGTISTINNMIHKDNLVDKSDFLTRRFGSDQLSQKLWQKATNAGFALMTGTDYFTANQIWRSKYYEYLGNGLSENMAIKGADDFASRIMGDRSKGSTATLFNSKTLGFFTQFQLEVNNQWSTMIHDNKMDLQRGNKTASSIVFQLGQLFAMSYLFNNLMESCTGSDVMLDPIELLKMLFNPDDEEEDMEQRATKVLGEVVNNIPFASIFTGGRIPVGEAFGGVSTAFKYATGQTDDYGNNYEVKDVTNDMIESAFYWILPTGFSQLNKTRKGLSMYDENLLVKGSYTESGNLRFTADESLGGKVKAALFGQYSSKESQDYIASGFKTIPKGKINEMKSLEMNSTEYRKYREELANAGKTNEEKLDYISGLKLPISKKNIMANNVVNSDKYQIDMSKYDDFSSYEEMQMYYTNPTKYQTITQISSYENYNNYQSEINAIKERYNNTNDKKNAIIKYVNDLMLTIPQKAMLIKMNYSSFKNYDNQIIEYINSQDLTIQEKTDILTELGFTVRNGRVYS